MKTCSQCGLKKPLTEFHVEPRRPCGRYARCKMCHNNHVRAYRVANQEKVSVQRMAANRRYFKANPEKRKAHKAVGEALKSGKLIRQPCEVCGDEKSHAHHDYYSKLLEVRWLCGFHHRAHHSQRVG